MSSPMIHPVIGSSSTTLIEALPRLALNIQNGDLQSLEVFE